MKSRAGSSRQRVKILNRRPIQESVSLRFGGRYVTVHRNQILVWVSIHLPGVYEPEGNAEVPGLAGHGEQPRVLRAGSPPARLAGIVPDLLDFNGDVEVNGQVVALREAVVWIFPNVPGRQDVAGDRRPFRLNMDGGIGVYARRSHPPGPRLPLLGFPPFSTAASTSGSIQIDGTSPSDRPPVPAAHPPPLPIVMRRRHPSPGRSLGSAFMAAHSATVGSSKSSDSGSSNPGSTSPPDRRSARVRIRTEVAEAKSKTLEYSG